MSPRRTDPKSKTQSSISLPTEAKIGIAIALVIVAGFGLYLIQSGSVSQSTPPPVTRSAIASSGRTMGDPNAKLELIEYSDFQ